MFRYRIFLLTCLITVNSYAQDTGYLTGPLNMQLDNAHLERIISQANEEVVDYLIDQNASHNIHTITKEELRSLGFLTENQIENFLSYRENWGPFKSIYELRAIDDFDNNTIIRFIQSLESFKLDFSQKEVQKFRHYLSVGAMRSIQQKAGSKRDTTGHSTFKGDAFKWFYRYNIKYKNKITLAITAEKDEGETMEFDLSNGKFLFDNISAYLNIQDIGLVKSLTIGDFKFQSGQGLVFSNAFHFGKGTETITSIRKANTHIRPVSSSYEVKDFSGLGLTLDIKNMTVNILASKVNRDATLYVDDDDPYERKYFKSFYTSGLHRTDSELEKKNTVAEKNVGFNVDYINPTEKINIGLNGLLSDLSLPIIKDQTPRNRYRFRGRSNTNFSGYFNYYGRKTHVFSEIALSGNMGYGVISGLIHQLHHSTYISLLYRNLKADYHAFHSNAFGESGSTSNETGLYVGFKFSPFKNITISMYHDTYSFPWLRGLVDKPSNGSDWMVFWEYDKYRHVYLSLRCNYESDLESRDNNESPLDEYHRINQLKVTLNTSLYANNNLKFFHRLQINRTTFMAKKDKGFLMAAGLDYRKNRCGFLSTFSIFDANNYLNRLYFYQSTIPHGYIYPFFYNQGTNINLTFKYRLNSTLRVWANFNQTRYLNINDIGNGLDKIDGNKKSIISLELIANI